jgi:hypothetical protein
MDSQTKQPLAGVVTTWRQDRSDLFRGPGQIGPTNLSASGQDGMIKIEGVHGGTWSGLLIFSCPGYRKLYGYYRYYGPEYLNLTGNVYDEEKRFVLEQPIVTAAVTNGCFVVPMDKIPSDRDSGWVPGP